MTGPGVTTLELPAGTVEYRDSGGDGPVLVLLHGLLMDGSLWDEVAADLTADHRVIVPTLPLGAHRRPVRAAADLSLYGLARLVVEFVERLGLRDITLVGNDTGGALVQLVMAESPAALGKAVLVSCDAFDNVPPGLTGKAVVLIGKLSPALFGVVMQQMRIRAIRRLPIAFGWLTKRGDAVTRQWLTPLLTDTAIRRDTVRLLRAIGADRRVLIGAAEALPGFDRPTLIVWASADRVMPPAHGRRLAALLPHSTLVEVDDSYTLIPLDQPVRLARIIREFVSSVGVRRSSGSD